MTYEFSGEQQPRKSTDIAFKSPKRISITIPHNAYEHLVMFPQRVSVACGDIVDGTGFTIYAQTELRLTGDISVHWQWS
jgi:hypothetical protein